MTTNKEPHGRHGAGEKISAAGCLEGTARLPICQDNIPQELKETPHWVLWKAKRRDGKITKVPYSITGKEAKSNDPKTWNTFKSVLKKYNAGGYDGIYCHKMPLDFSSR